jgi:dCMP deaminase
MNWNEIWIEFANTIANKSHHDEFKVGAVVVTEDNTQVLAVGYNGNASGLPNKPDSINPGESGLIHAEINCLIKLDYNNHKEKKMYLTLSPCEYCAKCIVNSGIKNVYYKEEYRITKGIDILKECGVNVTKIQ